MKESKTAKEFLDYLDSEDLRMLVKMNAVYTITELTDLRREFDQQKLASHVLLTLLLVQSLVMLFV